MRGGQVVYPRCHRARHPRRPNLVRTRGHERLSHHRLQRGLNHPPDLRRSHRLRLADVGARDADVGRDGPTRDDLLDSRSTRRTPLRDASYGGREFDSLSRLHERLGDGCQVEFIRLFVGRLFVFDTSHPSDDALLGHVNHREDLRARGEQRSLRCPRRGLDSLGRGSEGGLKAGSFLLALVARRLQLGANPGDVVHGFAQRPARRSGLLGLGPRNLERLFEVFQPLLFLVTDRRRRTRELPRLVVGDFAVFIETRGCSLLLEVITSLYRGVRCDDRALPRLDRRECGGQLVQRSLRRLHRNFVRSPQRLVDKLGSSTADLTEV